MLSSFLTGRGSHFIAGRRRHGPSTSERRPPQQQQMGGERSLPQSSCANRIIVYFSGQRKRQNGTRTGSALPSSAKFWTSSRPLRTGRIAIGTVKKLGKDTTNGKTAQIAPSPSGGKTAQGGVNYAAKTTRRCLGLRQDYRSRPAPSQCAAGGPRRASAQQEDREAGQKEE